MGNSKSSFSTKYIAKETFHPSEMDFYNFPLRKDGSDYDKKSYQLRIENPLRITINDELEMFGNVDDALLEELLDIGIAQASSLGFFGGFFGSNFNHYGIWSLYNGRHRVKDGCIISPD